VLILITGLGCARAEPFRSDIAILPEYFSEETLTWAEACEPNAAVKSNLANIHGTMKVLGARAGREEIAKGELEFPIFSMWPFKR